MLCHCYNVYGDSCQWHLISIIPLIWCLHDMIIIVLGDVRIPHQFWDNFWPGHTPLTLQTTCVCVLSSSWFAWAWPVSFLYHDDVIKWKHFPRYWPFVRRIHWSPVKSPQDGMLMKCRRTLNLGISSRLRLYQENLAVMVWLKFNPIGYWWESQEN